MGEHDAIARLEDLVDRGAFFVSNQLKSRHEIFLSNRFVQQYHLPSLSR
jgi:hypothetical protein